MTYEEFNKYNISQYLFRLNLFKKFLLQNFRKW